MEYIQNWVEKKLTCRYCGCNKSVKYMHDGQPVCNKCILICIADSVTFKEPETVV